MSKFSCSHCSYETNSSSSWKKHIVTKKHLKNIEIHENPENPDRYIFTHEVLNELKSFHDYQNIQLFCDYIKTEKGHDLRCRFESILKETDIPANVVQEFYNLLGL
jgi:hypothetical protein